MIGASWAIVTCQRSPSSVGASGPRIWASEASIATANVCTMPISREATSAPVSEPKPPTTTTTKRIGPSKLAISGWVTSAGPAMTPARPAGAKHQHEQARDVVSEHRDRFRVGQRGLNDEPDAGSGQHREQRDEHRDR